MFLKKVIKKELLTINSVSIEWLEVSKNTCKMSTHQAYSRIVYKHLFNSCISYIQIQRLNQIDISKFTSKLVEDKLSERTINDILSVLNSILKYSNKCYRTKLIPISFIRVEKKEMRVLSINEQRNLERILKDDIDIYKFAILLALYTGMRIGEICALQWKDISNNSISIYKTMHRLYDVNGNSKIFIDSPKTTNSIRIIPYPLLLNSYIESFRGNEDDFVLSTFELKKIEPRLLQLKFKKIIESCDFDDVTFHTLRHTFATRCIECGFDVKSLSEILGHSDVKTTLNKYVHSSMELKRSNMEKLSQIAI